MLYYVGIKKETDLLWGNFFVEIVKDKGKEKGKMKNHLLRLRKELQEERLERLVVPTRSYEHLRAKPISRIDLQCGLGFRG